MRIVEDGEEELVVPLEPHPWGTGRKRAGETPRARRESGESVRTAREVQRIAVADIDAVRPGQVCDDVLELVLHAEGDQVVQPAHRQEKDAPAVARHEACALSTRSVSSERHGLARAGHELAAPCSGAGASGAVCLGGTDARNT